MGAQGAGFADGIDDLAQDFGVGDIVGGAARMAQPVFALEALDLGSEDFFEAVVHLAGMFEGIAVNQQGGWLGTGLAAVFVEIGEQRQQAGDNTLLAILVFHFVAGDVLEDFARNGGIAAYGDEDGRLGEQVPCVSVA